jgi:thiol-disulfide isomerase/thioredoxin
MIKLEVDILTDIIRSEPKLMVMFGTDWCGNCDILKPEFERVSKLYKSIPFVFVNPDNLQNSAKVVDLTNIPMVVAFENGTEVIAKFGNNGEIVQQVLDVLL